MMRIFVDSSAVFSAAYSPHGHARDLLRAATRGEIKLVLSPTVLEETRRNLAESAPRAMPYFEFVLVNLPIEVVRPTKMDVLAAAEHTAMKDAPIVAAAKRAGVEMPVTLDKKHLLGRPALVRFIGTDIVTPKEAISRLGG